MTNKKIYVVSQFAYVHRGRVGVLLTLRMETLRMGLQELFFSLKDLSHKVQTLEELAYFG